MSFYINSTELQSAYFNGSEVSSIYYNGTLVWESGWKWPGWSSATWEDVYTLCKAKQSGEITAWPSDVKLGATKTVTLSTAVLGTSSISVRIIGIDIDGAGTITFQTVNTLANKTAFGSSNKNWIGSTARTLCQNFYNYCNAKPYIKTVSKGTCTGTKTARTGTPTYNNETVFLLSEREVGLDKYALITVANSTTTKAECTYGVNAAYPYFTSDTTRRKSSGGYYRVWLLRSPYYQSDLSVIGISTAGQAKTATYHLSSYYLAPAFVIG